MKLCLIILLNIVLITTTIAQSEREKGFSSYKKGDYQSAIKSLSVATKSDKKDGEAWNILGMSYLQLSKFKESRKALENAIKLSPQNASYQTNIAYVSLLSNKLSQAEKEIQKAIALDSQSAAAFYIRGIIFFWKGKFDNAIADANLALNLNKNLEVFYTLKSDSYLYKFGQEIVKSRKVSENIGFLQQAIESLESCLKDCENTSVKEDINSEIEGLKAFYNYFSKQKDETLFAPVDFSSLNKMKNSKAKTVSNQTNQPVAPPDPTVTPLKITSKPRASYTDSARQAGVQGIITLAVLFSADKTKKVLVIKPLSNGLTAEAVIAARKIDFTPQMKDGKPISVVRLVQYTFTLY